MYFKLNKKLVYVEGTNTPIEPSWMELTSEQVPPPTFQIETFFNLDTYQLAHLYCHQITEVSVISCSIWVYTRIKDIKRLMLFTLFLIV
jgi:hypothetical protein